MFIREVSSNTTNYTGQANNLIASISEKINNNYKVIMSLENKNDRKKYPASWLVINEPEKHIHSLMYYSIIVVSSGDSMAREGAILGILSVYCGVREMTANKVMIDKGMLFHKFIDEVPEFLKSIINNEIIITEQDTFRSKLCDEWDDVTEFIIDKINGIIVKKNDSKDLYDKLKKLIISDKTKKDQLSLQASHTIKTNHSSKYFYNALNEIYNEINEK